MILDKRPTRSAQRSIWWDGVLWRPSPWSLTSILFQGSRFRCYILGGCQLSWSFGCWKQSVLGQI